MRRSRGRRNRKSSSSSISTTTLDIDINVLPRHGHKLLPLDGIELFSIDHNLAQVTFKGLPCFQFPVVGRTRRKPVDTRLYSDFDRSPNVGSRFNVLIFHLKNRLRMDASPALSANCCCVRFKASR